MTVTINPKLDNLSFSPVISGGIQAQLQKSGRLPPITVRVTSIETGQPTFLPRFLSYQFTSSVMIPVNTFNFTFEAPDDPSPINSIIKEGDIVSVFANDQIIANGIIDTVDVEWDANFGEKITIQGRDLMGQLEDQDAVNLQSQQLWGNNISASAVVNLLIQNTRIQGLDSGSNVSQQPRLFATEPGESKLAALQRHIESLNCVTFLTPQGKIFIGKPNMAQAAQGSIIMSKRNRNTTNVLSLKVTRAAATIPNFVIPIWTGQESVLSRVGPQQGLKNLAPAPSRLFTLGHILSKAVTVSTPMGGSPQDLAQVNLINASTQPGSSIDIQAYAKREIAKYNVKEVQVQAVVPGHFNNQAVPFGIDQVYAIRVDRGGDFEVNEDMYLYQVDYSLSEDTGQRTTLYFTRKGTIVADVNAGVVTQ